PDVDVRKQSKRVLENLQAPHLQRRADWLTPLPDLSALDESDRTSFSMNQANLPKKSRPPLSTEPKPEDLSQMNTGDNGFLFAAIALVVLTLGSLWWLRG
ncbi:MAG: tetratricopeptide repeat protein, partial [Leptolyngbyaceae cyanobacterium]